MKKKQLRNFIIAILMVVMVCFPTFVGAEEAPVTDPVEHAHVWTEWTVTSAPNCTYTGIQTRTCPICESVEEKSIPANGKHGWSAWKVTKKASLTKKGEQKRTCKYCKKTEKKVIAKQKPFIKLSAKKLTIYLKSSKTLKVTMANGDKISSFTSSKKSVATVSKKGKITAKKKGTTKITVKLKSKKKATCTVTVKAKPKKTTTDKTPSTEVKPDTTPSKPSTPSEITTDPSGGYDYIVNTSSKKFHYPTCSSKPTTNVGYYKGSREGIIDLGYEPCKRCNP